jgi:iron complex outermembrane receptor protein
VLADHSFGRGEVRSAFSGTRIRYRETLNRGVPSDYEQRLWSSAFEVDYPLAGTARVSAGWAADASSTPETGGKESLGSLSEWGGRLGVSTLAFGGNARIHSSVSRRARFASLRELYSGALNRFDPNPTLRPERLVGMEVGATMLRSGSQFQAVVFHHRLEDAIVRVTLPNRLFRRINRDELRSTGMELLAGVTRNRVTLSGDVLVQHVRIQDPAVRGTQRQPELQPAFRSNVDLAMPLPLGARGRVGLNYTGRQYCVNPDLGGNVSLGAQALLNGGAEREFGLRGGGLLSRLVASIAVDNLGDSAFFDQCGLPYAGRTLRFGVALR